MKTYCLILPLVLTGFFLRASDIATPAPAAEANTAPAAPTAIEPAKQAEIQKMIQEAGILSLMNQMKERMLTMFKTQHSKLPPEFWTRLDSEMKMDDLLEKIIPLYDKYYSLEDLKAINAFNESPAGRRMVAVRPQLMAESMEIGKTWGARIGAEVAARVKKEEESSTPATSTASPPTLPPTDK